MFVIFSLTKGNKEAVDVYVQQFALPIRRILGKISSFVPFSLMEVLIVLFLLWCAFFVFKTAYIFIKEDRNAKRLFTRVYVLILIACYISTSYSMLFGLDYYGSSFSEKSGLISGGVAAEDLKKVSEYFLIRANALAEKVPRSESGSFLGDVDEMVDYSTKAYSEAYEVFPFLESEIYRPKKLFFSKLQSYMGYTGVYFAFTGESNINADAPAVFIPSTLCHEIAHQKGITSEAECNFVGIFASATSDNPVFQYSGWCSGLSHLLNALYKADYDAWYDVRIRVSPYINLDWKENNEYWDSFDGTLEKVTDAVYESYLQSYGQMDGLRSYGACVDLLVEYYLPYCK